MRYVVIMRMRLLVVLHGLFELLATTLLLVYFYQLVVEWFKVAPRNTALVGEARARVGHDINDIEHITTASGVVAQAINHCRYAWVKQWLLAQDLLLSQERSRAARELHDSLGNRLTAVAMSIDYARNVADHDTERARDELAVARRDVGDALGDLRIWVRAMNPANRASEFGLSGLHDVAASFRGTGLSVEVDVPAQHPPLGQRLELFVVRFVQEGLTNALRHGRAEQVWVEVKLREGELLLQLRDDGAGAIGVPFEGFGLRALREQTAELGGRFEASNAPEGGFRIRAALPLPMLAQTAPGELSERVS